MSDWKDGRLRPTAETMPMPEHFAVYDNPNTACRELWRNQTIEAIVTHEFMRFGHKGEMTDWRDSVPPVMGHSPWKDGYLYGNADHVHEAVRP